MNSLMGLFDESTNSIIRTIKQSKSSVACLKRELIELEIMENNASQKRDKIFGFGPTGSQNFPRLIPRNLKVQTNRLNSI